MSSSSSTTISSSDFCVCANEASPGATVLKNALVKNGELFSLDFGSGLLMRTVFFFDEDVALAARDVSEDLVACGAAEDLVSCDAVEVDGSCLIGDRERGGSLALLSSSVSNAVLQNRANEVSDFQISVPRVTVTQRAASNQKKGVSFSANQEQAQDQ